MCETALLSLGPVSTQGDTSGSQGSDTATVAVAVSVPLLIVILLIVLVVMVAGWYMRRGKRTGSMDVYFNRPVSRSSKDIWFTMEENVVRMTL